MKDYYRKRIYFITCQNFKAQYNHDLSHTSMHGFANLSSKYHLGRHYIIVQLRTWNQGPYTRLRHSLDRDGFLALACWLSCAMFTTSDSESESHSESDSCHQIRRRATKMSNTNIAFASIFIVVIKTKFVIPNIAMLDNLTQLLNFFYI